MSYWLPVLYQVPSGSVPGPYYVIVPVSGMIVSDDSDHIRAFYNEGFGGNCVIGLLHQNQYEGTR